MHGRARADGMKPDPWSMTSTRMCSGPSLRIARRRCPSPPYFTLLVSELITNSVKYGRSEVVRLELHGDGDGRLRVDVVDEGGGFVPTARDRPATEVGGWGLHLVHTLADRWGVATEASHVWFEIGPGSSRAESIAA